MCIPDVAKAAKISFIRDAEIERTISLFAKPVFEAAGLSADSIQIYLVNDRRLNAFVAGGQKLFLNTGFLKKTRTPEQVIGVIAHESGHIAGGHLARLKDKMESFSPESILGYVLGGAAILAGKSDAGGALIFGGQQMAQRSLLKYSRTEEGSADQAAVTYLDRAEISSKGLLDFFKILKRAEGVNSSDQNPYIRSHPLTQERINFLSSHVKASPLGQKKLGADYQEMHARMVAKLDSYLLSPTHTLRIYPLGDNSIAARYARAQAYHKDNDIDKAISEIDNLINERPKDAYFHEMKGQFHYENGHITEAVEAYETALELAPDTPLINQALAKAYIESGEHEQILKAIPLLEYTTRHEPRNSFAWRQLGIAYGKTQQMAKSSLALAEEAYLRRQYKEAIYLAGRAEKDLKTGSPDWLQAQDLRLSAERLLKKQRK